MNFSEEMKPVKSHEEKIIMMMPNLLKAIKKTLPQIRSKYAAKELIDIAQKIAVELKSIK